jgi:chaperonin GroES
MELKAKFNAVFVKPRESEETTHGNIIVPDVGKENNETGEVIAVGPGHHSVTGEFIPTQTKVGEIVILPTMGFTKFKFQGEEYYAGKENELLGAIEK